MYYIKVREGLNEKLKKEDKLRIRILIFIYTIHFAYLKAYTTFENTGSNRSREICDRFFLLKNVHMYYIRITEGKNEN